jgi:hypothetical protein
MEATDGTADGGAGDHRRENLLGARPGRCIRPASDLAIVTGFLRLVRMSHDCSLGPERRG